MLNSTEFSALLPLQVQDLCIRLFTPEDIDADYIGWLNDAQIMQFSNQRFKQHSRASCLAYWQSFQQSENLFLALMRQVTPQHWLKIGTMTLYSQPVHQTVDMGLLVAHPDSRGKGYGHLAWQQVMDLLLQRAGVRKVTAGTLSCNAPMLSIMQRCGMHEEGRRRQQECLPTPGVYADVVYYAKFAE